MKYVILPYAAPGGGKSTFALSGTGKTYYMETDVGSWERATAGLDIDEEMFIRKEYFLPLTSLRDRGRISMAMAGQSKSGPLTVVHELKGWTKLMEQFLDDFVEACEDEEVHNIVIDSGTELWHLLQNGLRERIQAAISVDNTEKELKRAEFEEPNSMVWEMCQAAKGYHKNLIIPTMEKQQWRDNKFVDGSHEADGSKRLTGYADIILRLVMGSEYPVAEVIKAAAGGPLLVGMKIENPTVEKVTALFDAVAFLRKKKVPLPKPLNIQMILRLAEEEAE